MLSKAQPWQVTPFRILPISWSPLASPLRPALMFAAQRASDHRRLNGGRRDALNGAGFGAATDAIAVHTCQAALQLKLQVDLNTTHQVL